MGLGAVIALAVATRRRELAIRAALGANRAQLRSAVIREGFWLTAGGTVLGLVLAVAAARAVAALLIGVEPHDAIALGGAAFVVCATSLAACWWPARKAANANPMEISARGVNDERPNYERRALDQYRAAPIATTTPA